MESTRADTATAKARPFSVNSHRATGSIGALVVAETSVNGTLCVHWCATFNRARELPPEAERVVGDLTRPETLPNVVANVDAIVLHSRSYDDGGEATDTSTTGARNVLSVLDCGQCGLR